MKSRVLPLSLLFLAIYASTVVLVSTARADSRTVTFSESVTVDGTLLKPGAYKVTVTCLDGPNWTPSGMPSAHRR